MNYFFDMDGTLAVYEREAYVSGPFWYEDLRNIHYFRGLPEIKRSVECFDRLLSYDPSSVYVITDVSVPDEAIYYEMATDKIMWLSERFKNFLPEHFFIINCLNNKKKLTKAEAAQKMLSRPLCKDDILYDDYNGNLLAWKDAGGTPVKVLNGLNQSRDDMRCVTVW